MWLDTDTVTVTVTGRGTLQMDAQRGAGTPLATSGDFLMAMDSNGLPHRLDHYMWLTSPGLPLER